MKGFDLIYDVDNGDTLPQRLLISQERADEICAFMDKKIEEAEDDEPAENLLVPLCDFCRTPNEIALMIFIFGKYIQKLAILNCISDEC